MGRHRDRYLIKQVESHVNWWNVDGVCMGAHGKKKNFFLLYVETLYIKHGGKCKLTCKNVQSSIMASRWKQSKCPSAAET